MIRASRFILVVLRFYIEFERFLAFYHARLAELFCFLASENAFDVRVFEKVNFRLLGCGSYIIPEHLAL